MKFNKLKMKKYIKIISIVASAGLLLYVAGMVGMYSYLEYCNSKDHALFNKQGVLSRKDVEERILNRFRSIEIEEREQEHHFVKFVREENPDMKLIHIKYSFLWEEGFDLLYDQDGILFASYPSYE